MLSAIAFLLAAAPQTGSGPLPSAFCWGDYDADGLDDALAVPRAGEARLLKNLGDGTFEDVTELMGLSALAGVRGAAWADYDADGRLDLFLVRANGASELLRQSENGLFADATDALRLDGPLAGDEARWVDYDADGRPDLLVTGAAGGRLLHNLGGAFEAVELGLPGVVPPWSAVLESAPASGASRATIVTGRTAVDGPDGAAPDAARGGTGGVQEGQSLAGAMRIGGVGSQPIGAELCMTGIDDQAGGLTCLNASRTPTLGMLYPLGQDLFVATSGFVGVGTTAPTSRLTLAGPDDPLAGPILRLQNPNNAFEAGRIRMAESSSTFLGGYVHYDGVGNRLNLGVHNVNSVDPANDVDALSILRSNGFVGVGKVPSFPGARLDVGGSGNFDGLVTARAVEVESVTGAGLGLRVTQFGVSSGTGLLVDSSNSNSVGIELQMTGAGTGTSIGMRSVVAASNSQAVLASTSGPATSTAVRATATGAGIAGRFESATNLALTVTRSDNAGDIFEAGNVNDVEFRVESTGNVFCDGSFTGGGADYAEWLPRADAGERFAPGDVVAVRSGSISKRLAGAEQVLVISTNPVLIGNAAAAEESTREGHEVVAFLGQVPVRVVGRVASGDFLLPSGRDDGTAVAVAPRELDGRRLATVIGRAWESSGEAGEKLVLTAIGLDATAAAACAIDALRDEVERLAGLESRLAAVESHLANVAAAR